MPRKLNVDAGPRDKLLTLYQRLTLEDKRHYLSDIARDLGCSSQTVTRLVSVIERHLGKDTDIEVGSDGRRRFYRVRSKTAEKGLGFSFEELHYLAVCNDIAAAHHPEGVAARINRSLTALALHLGEASSQSLSGAPIGFHNKGFIDYAPHHGTISTLRQAISKKQVCRVIYNKPGGPQTGSEYRYAPGRIIAMSGTLYVQGYRLAEGSLLKDRPTTFSLHRIVEIEPLVEFFGFDAADTDASSFGLNWHEPRRVQIRFAPSASDYVRDRIWSDDQTIDGQDDGGIILTVTTTSEKELNAWVWGFGGLATVIDDGDAREQ